MHGCCRRCGRRKQDAGTRPLRVLHLGRQCPLPDQLVEAEGVLVQARAHLVRRPEVRARGPNGLVRLLGVGPPGVGARLLRRILGPKKFDDLQPRGSDRLARKRGRIGAHVCDVAVLVQALGHPHRPLRGEPELPGRLLLQSRGDEGRVGPAGERLFLDLGDHGPGRRQLMPQPSGLGLQQQVGGGLQLAGIPVEVPSARQNSAAQSRHARGEAPRLAVLGLKLHLHGPVVGGYERHPLPLPLDHDPGRHRLDAARRQPRLNLLPQHGRNFVAIEPIQYPPRLLGVDQTAVDLPGVAERRFDGGLRDLVEDHPPHRHLGTQHLLEVPRDRLALAVLIRCEHQLVGAAQRAPKLGDLTPLLAGDHVQGIEATFDINTQTCPGAPPVLLRHLGSGPRQVPDVTDRGLDLVAGTEVALDRPGLGRRLDDDERVSHACGRP